MTIQVLYKGKLLELKLVHESQKSDWLIKRYYEFPRLLESVLSHEKGALGNPDFTESQIVGFRSRNCHYVVDFILMNRDQDIRFLRS